MLSALFNKHFLPSFSLFQRWQQGEHPGQPAVADGAVRQQSGDAGGRPHGGLPGTEEEGGGPAVLHAA